jgi:predicted permease
MISGLIARARSLWRGVRRRSDLEWEMEEEFRSHIEFRTADLVRQGLALDDAARQARQEFGRPERYKKEGVAARGLRFFDELGVSWLDFKLGFRMLVRYPGLTFVGGLAIAFAIWVGAGTFEFLNQVVSPNIPLPDGNRIVAIQVVNTAESRRMPRLLHDYEDWRTTLRTVPELGAYRTTERNLITASGDARPAIIAEVTESALRLARVQPLLGRSILADDESPAAPPVLVIGWELWQRRFQGDPDILGKVVRLGRDQATIVGVMPRDFAFPISHEAWAPLRLDVVDYERGYGPPIEVVGRLAPEAKMEDAQAELTTYAQRAANNFPATHAHLRPRVLPLARSWMDVPSGATLTIWSMNLFVVMLLTLVCSNVALLLFARAASREGEIAVRNAIGASRARIITQLFAEALVLGTFGAALGLSAAGFGLRWGLGSVEAQFLAESGPLPFWFRSTLSPATVFYVVLLTLLAALIAGVLPALKVTRGIGARLRQASAGGGGLQFGGVWTAVIITQVALTVALPSASFQLRRDAEEIRTLEVGFPPQQYLSLQLAMDRDAAAEIGDTSAAAFQARFTERRVELERRLMNDPDVLGVTFAGRLPRMYHEWNQIEVDDGAVAPTDERGHRVSSTRIAEDYFEVLQAPPLSGRGFTAADVATGAQIVLVNQPFVDAVLGGRNPIGRRIRYIADEDDRRPREDGEWYEIVGVARDLGMTSGYGRAGIYHPMQPAEAHPVFVAVHVRGDPAAYAPVLRAMATAVDPTLRVNALMPLDRVIDGELKFLSFWFRLTLIVSGVALLLSLAGIYAVMAFTVARRTREIGIRVALGAERGRVLLAIFRRPLIQVGLGVAGGALVVGVLGAGISGGATPQGVALVSGYAALMFAVCALACIVPTRRALAVEPTEALRSEG